MSSDELVADLKLAAVAQDGTLPAKAERPFAPVAPDATRATQPTQPARAQAIFFMLSPFSSGRLGLAAPPFPTLRSLRCRSEIRCRSDRRSLVRLCRGSRRRCS